MQARTHGPRVFRRGGGGVIKLPSLGSCFCFCFVLFCSVLARLPVRSVMNAETPTPCMVYRVSQKTEQSIVDTVDFSGLCSNQQLSFFTLMHRASFPHYNNTKIIKFGWELFILWVISYGLSFSRFAQFPKFRGTINDKWMANPENDSP